LAALIVSTVHGVRAHLLWKAPFVSSSSSSSSSVCPGQYHDRHGKRSLIAEVIASHGATERELPGFQRCEGVDVFE
jgi:hypothetical protein